MLFRIEVLLNVDEQLDWNRRDATKEKRLVQPMLEVHFEVKHTRVERVGDWVIEVIQEDYKYKSKVDGLTIDVGNDETRCC